jgi:hypothetical protein
MGISLFYTNLLKHVDIKLLIKSKIQLNKINKVARLVTNSTVDLSYYSPLAANTNAIYILLKKNPKNQKEEVKRLLIFEKEKFEEEIQLMKKIKNTKRSIINCLIKMSVIMLKTSQKDNIFKDAMRESQNLAKKCY